VGCGDEQSHKGSSHGKQACETSAKFQSISSFSQSGDSMTACASSAGQDPPVEITTITELSSIIQKLLLVGVSDGQF
jgi:hypothetical protein